MATLDELVLANGAKPGGQQGRSKRRGSIDVAARMKADIAAVAATQAAAAEGAGVEGAEVSLEERFEMLQRASSHSAYFRGFEDEELRILAANMAIFHFDAGETIMQKGESASWVGVVLDGELEARDESGMRLRPTTSAWRSTGRSPWPRTGRHSGGKHLARPSPKWARPSH